MTVEEFTLSYFSLGNKIDWLHVVQNDGNGHQLNKYNGYIGETIYMKPEVRKATIRTWWVDTRNKKIIVCIKTEEPKC